MGDSPASRTRWVAASSSSAWCTSTCTCPRAGRSGSRSARSWLLPGRLAGGGLGDGVGPPALLVEPAFGAVQVAAGAGLVVCGAVQVREGGTPGPVPVGDGALVLAPRPLGEVGGLGDPAVIDAEAEAGVTPGDLNPAHGGRLSSGPDSPPPVQGRTPAGPDHGPAGPRLGRAPEATAGRAAGAARW